MRAVTSLVGQSMHVGDVSQAVPREVAGEQPAEVGLQRWIQVWPSFS
jgi:hypothetical protein